MPSYDIQRWDAIIPKGNDLPYPVAYIKPNEEFLNYAKANNYMFLVTITDTGGRYEGASVVAMLDNSGLYPTYRPNFFNDTGLYTLTIFSNWAGYPKQNGKVFIQGLVGPDKLNDSPKVENKEFVPPQPLPWNWSTMEGYNNNKKSLSTAQVGYILIILGLILFICLVCSIKSKKQVKS
jgi:hypothetical protein